MADETGKQIPLPPAKGQGQPTQAAQQQQQYQPLTLGPQTQQQQPQGGQPPPATQQQQVQQPQVQQQQQPQQPQVTQQQGGQPTQAAQQQPQPQQPQPPLHGQVGQPQQQPAQVQGAPTQQQPQQQAVQPQQQVQPLQPLTQAQQQQVQQQQQLVQAVQDLDARLVPYKTSDAAVGALYRAGTGATATVPAVPVGSCYFIDASQGAVRNGLTAMVQALGPNAAAVAILSAQRMAQFQNAHTSLNAEFQRLLTEQQNVIADLKRSRDEVVAKDLATFAQSLPDAHKGLQAKQSGISKTLAQLEANLQTQGLLNPNEFKALKGLYGSQIILEGRVREISEVEAKPISFVGKAAEAEKLVKKLAAETSYATQEMVETLNNLNTTELVGDAVTRAKSTKAVEDLCRVDPNIQQQNLWLQAPQANAPLVLVETPLQRLIYNCQDDNIVAGTIGVPDNQGGLRFGGGMNNPWMILRGQVPGQARAPINYVIGAGQAATSFDQIPTHPIAIFLKSKEINDVRDNIQKLAAEIQELSLTLPGGLTTGPALQPNVPLTPQQLEVVAQTIPSLAGQLDSEFAKLSVAIENQISDLEKHGDTMLSAYRPNAAQAKADAIQTLRNMQQLYFGGVHGMVKGQFAPGQYQRKFLPALAPLRSAFTGKMETTSDIIARIFDGLRSEALKYVSHNAGNSRAAKKEIELNITGKLDARLEQAVDELAAVGAIDKDLAVEMLRRIPAEQKGKWRKDIEQAAELSTYIISERSQAVMESLERSMNRPSMLSGSAVTKDEFLSRIQRSEEFDKDWVTRLNQRLVDSNRDFRFGLVGNRLEIKVTSNTFSFADAGERTLSTAGKQLSGAQWALGMLYLNKPPENLKHIVIDQGSSDTQILAAARVFSSQGVEVVLTLDRNVSKATSAEIIRLNDLARQNRAAQEAKHDRDSGKAHRDLTGSPAYQQASTAGKQDMLRTNAAERWKEGHKALTREVVAQANKGKNIDIGTKASEWHDRIEADVMLRLCQEMKKNASNPGKIVETANRIAVTLETASREGYIISNKPRTEGVELLLSVMQQEIGDKMLLQQIVGAIRGLSQYEPYPIMVAPDHASAGRALAAQTPNASGKAGVAKTEKIAEILERLGQTFKIDVTDFNPDNPSAALSPFAIKRDFQKYSDDIAKDKQTGTDAKEAVHEVTKALSRS